MKTNEVEQTVPVQVVDGCPELRAAAFAAQMRALAVGMRPHQWLKNTFVLAPLLFAGRIGELAAVVRGLAAFICFCLICSALYLLNDLLDAPGDRQHPEKRHRPIASGALPRNVAWFAAAILAAPALALAYWVGPTFLLLTLAYGLLVVGYCLCFRQIVLLDVMTIAFGFTLRVVAGAAAVEATPSHWLMICAFLLALYLAVAKRRRELLFLAEGASPYSPVLERYSLGFLDQVVSILIGATLVSYALYTVAPNTVARHGTEDLIYGTVFVLYGLLRYLLLIQRADHGGDPAKLLVSDKPLLINAALWFVYNGVVIYRDSLTAIWNSLAL